MSDDTLERIAANFFIKSDELCRLNGMGIDEFIPGKFIVLPKTDNFYDVYVVHDGDTLYSLSKKYNIDLKTLYAINGLDDGDYIYPNQEILVPKENVSIYVTKDNESLSDISNNINIPVSLIISSNPNLILTSDQLIFFTEIS